MNLENNLNDKQSEAVKHTEGPLLILAGAGSGKTKVLVHRIAYLIEHMGVSPYNIMAITFTNKAAAEMRERVERIIPNVGSSIWVMTFHASCVRMLRRFIDRIGYDNHFSIYDTEDQKTLIKRIYKNLNLDPKIIKEKTAIRAISSYKDELTSPEEALRQTNDFYDRQIINIYSEYQKALKQNNALDFDDIIVKCVELLERDEEVREYYQEKFKYIMVDEYQDTNNAQFRLIKPLADKYKNLCVVGDDDQSIYKFRGANIFNILNFENVYKDAKVIKLEQNYRSKANILNVANAVIKNNKGRKDKSLWTASDSGEKIRVMEFENAASEAEFIISEIKQRASDYSEWAVLYRTNAQSRLLEERCVLLNIPYQLVGGVNFYQRKEIKDIVAYLKILSNPNDDISLLRVINLPKRGIGASSIAKISMYASLNDLSLWDVLMDMDKIEEFEKLKAKFDVFSESIENLQKTKEEVNSVAGMIDHIMDEINYKSVLLEEGSEEALARMENIEEFKNKARDYESTELEEFLEDIALIADIDRYDDDSKRVTLMTLHAAKGLEFPYVYMSGMEEGLFPSSMSLFTGDESDVEEERRLCYVGITRAKKELCMTFAKFRMQNGDMRYGTLSRFVNEIPDEFIQTNAKKRKSNDLRTGSFVRKQNKNTENYYNEVYRKSIEIKKTSKLNYDVGDRVRHISFGEGTVIDIEDGAKDYKVSVDFDKFGVKKMFAGFAKLDKI